MDNSEKVSDLFTVCGRLMRIAYSAKELAADQSPMQDDWGSIQNAFKDAVFALELPYNALMDAAKTVTAPETVKAVQESATAFMTIEPRPELVLPPVLPPPSGSPRRRPMAGNGL
jgi:hypothetical protein